MKRIIYLPVISAAVLFSGSCRKRSATSYFDGSNQKLQPPAATAAEWLPRLDEFQPLANGYAELPPQPEWEAILKRLRQPGNDSRSIKLRLLGDVLADDTGAASQSIRALLLTKPDNMKGYSRDESLKFLYTFSTDPAETSQWVEKTSPKEAAESDSSSQPDEIAKLLEEDKIDEALVKLREKIGAETRSSDKLTYFGQVAKIARLTDRHPLYEKTVEEMKNTALSVPASDSPGIYSFYGVFEELVLLKDWQTIRKIATRHRQGYQASDFHAICLAATYHLEGAAAYLAELGRSPEHGISDQQTYLQLLSERKLTETINI